MADNSKEDLLRLVKRVGAFLTVKISNIIRHMVLVLSFRFFFFFPFLWFWRIVCILSFDHFLTLFFFSLYFPDVFQHLFVVNLGFLSFLRWILGFLLFVMMIKIWFSTLSLAEYLGLLVSKLNSAISVVILCGLEILSCVLCD